VATAVNIEGRTGHLSRWHSEATLWLVGAGLSAVLFIVAFTTHDRQAVSITCYLACAVPLALLIRGSMKDAVVGWMAVPAAETEQGSLRVAGENLTLTVGAQSYSATRKELAEAFLELLTVETSALVLRMRNGAVWSVRDLPTHTCEELLATLCIEPSSRVARMYLVAPSALSVGAERLGYIGLIYGAIASFIAIVAGIAPIITGHRVSPALAVIIAIGMSLLLVAISLRWTPVVEVGADGVCVRGLWRRKKLRFSEISKVQSTTSGVRLDARDGRTLELPVVGRLQGSDRISARLALETRLRSLLDSYLVAKGSALGRS
jgi:hypothetical protein